MFSGLRKQFRRQSLRLTLWHALLFLAAALTMLGLTYVLIEKHLRAQERDAVEFKRGQYANEYERGGWQAVRNLTALHINREQKAFFVRVADAQNQTLFLRDAEDWAEFTPARLENEVLVTSAPRGWLTLKSPDGTELLIGFARLSDGSLIQVGKSIEELHQLLAGFRTAAVVVLLIFLPASIAGGAFVASRALRPVQDLTAATERIVATASFDARVPSRGTGDELDALVQLFNKMLDRIDRLIRGMRDSLDNVAHDLRTPMTRLRGKAQAALEHEADLETTRDALADCVEEAERAMTLLSTLMDIAEAESGLVEFPRAPVDVAELIHAVVDSYTEVAEEKGVTVTAEVPPGLSVSGATVSLRRVVANLLDNAIKYTPRGGHARITAERGAESVTIRIADTGIGILAEDLPRVWDRLFRGDKSRSAHGLGLGLSFVRAIVTAHGGTANVTSQHGSGTTATIVLPTTDPEPCLHSSYPGSNFAQIRENNQ